MDLKVMAEIVAQMEPLQLGEMVLLRKELNLLIARAKAEAEK